MGQRAIGFAKRTPAPGALVADALVRAMDDEETPLPIPLDLGPLIAPYRRHGRLSLRVERLPPRARLSRGHNNGDRSWSLMSDELDGLAFLPAKGGSESCVLGIRIVSLDGGDGGTLALLDYPVAPGEALAAPPPAPVVAEKPAPRREPDNAELRRLQDELSRAKAALAEQAKPAPDSSAALARAEKTIADLTAQLERAKSRSAAESARDRSDESERKRLRDEVARLKRSLATRDEELAELREESRTDSEAALADAERRWRDAEAERLNDAKAQWQGKSERALAEATAQFERTQSRAQTEAAQRYRDAEAELERLKDDLAAANEAIADRENDIADIQARLDDQIRKTDGLREHESEIRRLGAEIDGLRVSLAGRDRDLSQARADMEQAKIAWRKDSEAALAISLNDYKQGEAARLRAAEEQSQQQGQAALAKVAKRVQQLEADLAQSRAHAEALMRRGDSDDIKQLRRDFGHLQALLSEREQEIAQLRLDSEHARERWTADARMSLQKAEQDWRDEAEDSEARALRAQTTRRYIRDAILAASLSAIAVLFYLSMGDSGWWALIPGTSQDAPQIAATAPTPNAPAKQAAAPTLSVLKSANLRAAPSRTATVIATLPRDSQVASFERQGNWVRVKSDATRKEGWVYATYLSEPAK
ncbi:MAG TPA: SH3 domain-containing protein [Rhizomicrobium sp.]|nr:SH3 domain-containing protein [Rhizomicrobium sp.]